MTLRDFSETAATTQKQKPTINNAEPPVVYVPLKFPLKISNQKSVAGFASTSPVQDRAIQWQGISFAPMVKQLLTVQPVLDLFFSNTIRALLDYFPANTITVQKNVDSDEIWQLYILIDTGYDIDLAMQHLEHFDLNWWFDQDSKLRARILILLR
jgi:hypothetical protein